MIFFSDKYCNTPIFSIILKVDVSIFAPSEFAGSPTNHDDLEAWAESTPVKASGVMGFGMDIGEQTYENILFLLEHAI